MHGTQVEYAGFIDRNLTEFLTGLSREEKNVLECRNKGEDCCRLSD